jgi:hypothetical protein
MTQDVDIAVAPGAENARRWVAAPSALIAVDVLSQAPPEAERGALEALLEECKEGR